jgi:hypothetical protein
VGKITFFAHNPTPRVNFALPWNYANDLLGSSLAASGRRSNRKPSIALEIATHGRDAPVFSLGSEYFLLIE